MRRCDNGEKETEKKISVHLIHLIIARVKFFVIKTFPLVAFRVIPVEISTLPLAQNVLVWNSRSAWWFLFRSAVCYRFKILDGFFFTPVVHWIECRWSKAEATTTANDSYLRIVRLIPLFAVFDSWGWFFFPFALAWDKNGHNNNNNNEGKIMAVIRMESICECCGCSPCPL